MTAIETWENEGGYVPLEKKDKKAEVYFRETVYQIADDDGMTYRGE